MSEFTEILVTLLNLVTLKPDNTHDLAYNETAVSSVIATPYLTVRVIKVIRLL